MVLQGQQGTVWNLSSGLRRVWARAGSAAQQARTLVIRAEKYDSEYF